MTRMKSLAHLPLTMARNARDFARGAVGKMYVSSAGHRFVLDGLIDLALLPMKLARQAWDFVQGQRPFDKLLKETEEAKKDLERALDAMTQADPPTPDDQLLIAKLCLLASRCVYLQNAPLPRDAEGHEMFPDVRIPGKTGDYGAAIAKLASRLGMSYFPITGAEGTDIPYLGVFYRLKTDEQKPLLILAFRGTVTEKEWIRNYLALPIISLNYWFGSAIHTGFYTGFNRAMPSIRSLVRELKILKDPNTPVYYTGHSLGGAYATLLAARLLVNPTGEKKERVDTPAINFKGLYTFGAPRVGNRAFTKAFEDARAKYPTGKPDVLRFVNGDDIVTKVPPLCMGYRHVGYVPWSDQGRSRVPISRAPPTGFLRKIIFHTFRFYITDHFDSSYWQALKDTIATRP
ncbi:Alpha/Beta hydrolase protein [Mycena maculata]|uniref:Alpha/Beta hydrolase protein n=1 Tax=Mycena maculata TaxID=230809 RepID=A0AAD7MSX8_9AGAR|nr:Alpha/Beta hydrolase protein [Mycena maculata]